MNQKKKRKVNIIINNIKILFKLPDRTNNKRLN